MVTERILITVRTYPNISTKHVETVCTGGINEDGVWRRLYPVPLRHLDDESKYKTFDVITVKLGNNPDGRPESRRPDPASIKIVSHVKDWRARRDWVVPTAVPSMKAMQESGRTLAPVKVETVLDFKAMPESAQWSPKQLEVLKQNELFDGPEPLEKIPFDFRLLWRDSDGEEHDSKYLAWEAGEAWRNFRHKYSDPVSVMRDKWMRDLYGSQNDIWFFMGNYAGHRQNFGVCGHFVPPKEQMTSDSLWTA